MSNNRSLIMALILTFFWGTTTLSFAAVAKNKTFGYQLTLPDDWKFRISKDGGKAVLSPENITGLSITVRTDITKRPLNKKAVTKLFKNRLNKLVRLERDVVVQRGPSPTMIGKTQANEFSFKYTNFIEEKHAMRTLLFTTQGKGGRDFNFYRVDVKGNAGVAKNLRETIQTILDSFSLMGKSDGHMYGDTSVPMRRRRPSMVLAMLSDPGNYSSGGSSNSSGYRSSSRSSYSSSRGSRRSSSRSSRRSFGSSGGFSSFGSSSGGGGRRGSSRGGTRSRSGRSGSRKGPVARRKSSERTSGNAKGFKDLFKVVTDAKRANRLQRTFADRNVPRTEEQRRRAMQYFGNMDQMASDDYTPPMDADMIRYQTQLSMMNRADELAASGARDLNSLPAWARRALEIARGNSNVQADATRGLDPSKLNNLPNVKNINDIENLNLENLR